VLRNDHHIGNVIMARGASKLTCLGSTHDLTLFRNPNPEVETS
jgi:hypothetical protein